jgi:hypothetical protein
MPRLSTIGFSKMVFEHLQNCFHPEDFACGFPQLFQLYSHIAQGHIPCRITHILEATCLLGTTKLLGGIHPIVVGEELYVFTICALCFQFRDAFATHFSLHQFGIAAKGECETMIHGIMCILDLHLDWVVLQLDVGNAFNLVSRGIIFQNLHAIGRGIIQLIPFVHAFYAFESPLFCNHHSHEGDVTIIPFAMGFHHGGPLGGALFALVLAHRCFIGGCLACSSFP